jgi:hypothetical protein
MIPAGEIEEGVELWLKYRPWLRMRVAIRNARNRRRARLGKPLLPSLDEGSSMDETKLTIIRTLLKVAGAALVTHGVMSAADATTVQVAAEAVIGGLVTIAGVWWSHRTAKAADAAK